MDEAAKIETVKQYLRRTYAQNVAGLRVLAQTVFENGAVNAVTITGHAFADGSAQGQITFEPLAYLAAIEAVIAELAPDDTPAGPAPVRYADFGCSYLQT
jgi:hypothetical protein